ncbi:hypothetical protein E1287_25710 [Actinomadura sp. KC06]|uniref:hypothetical protein n=1 Tax=Actinomadura sp. KC06 TaxID=2530369 RepID=UPI001051DC3D|nr:hypothetical protein [Actinomadura sp. KC06]TDD31660.1 hypothetical protein E1287_25710 [Actinomadura sp. KC06]
MPNARATCPSCQGEKLPSHYLCLTCWRKIPEATRKALNRRDAAAFRRLSDLREQLRRNVPLNEIQVTP